MKLHRNLYSGENFEMNAFFLKNEKCVFNFKNQDLQFLKNAYIHFAQYLITNKQ